MARDDRGRRVRGPVVDHDDFIAGDEALCLEVGQAVVQQRGPVVGRDDDADASRRGRHEAISIAASAASGGDVSRPRAYER